MGRANRWEIDSVSDNIAKQIMGVGPRRYSIALTFDCLCKNMPGQPAVSVLLEVAFPPPSECSP